LGGKGANLAEMATIGLSVPPGLTISTEACREYQENVKNLPNGLWEEILEGLNFVQNEMGAFLGNPSKPLLVSVRSGAAVRAFSLYFILSQNLFELGYLSLFICVMHKHW